MTRTVRGLALAAAAALGLSASGCAGTGWEDVMNGNWNGSQVEGEIRGVDTRSRSLRVTTERGRDETVRYDSRTEVRDGDRRIGVSSLRRGDGVTLRLARDSRGALYTDYVYVRRSASDRGTWNDRADERREEARDRWEDRRDDNRSDSRLVRRFEGRVGRIDRSGQRFELRTDNHSYWVSLRNNRDGGDRSRFARLRGGEYVRVEGRLNSSSTLELTDFR